MFNETTSLSIDDYNILHVNENRIQNNSLDMLMAIVLIMFWLTNINRASVGVGDYLIIVIFFVG